MTASPPPPLRPTDWTWAAGLAAFALCLWRADALLGGTPDSFWHVAIGNWIFDHGALPARDPFSFTAPGKPWVPHEWLSEILMAGAWRLAGWGGVAALMAAAFGLAVFLVARALAGALPAMPALLLAGFAIWLPQAHLLARPHVLAMPVMAAWFWGLAAARAQNRAPPLWLLPVMAVWANLHGGFMLGLAFAALFAAEAVWADFQERRRDLARNVAAPWGLFLILSILAAMISPNGWAGMMLPFTMLGLTRALGVIGEWASPDFHALGAFEIWLLAALGLGWLGRVRLPAARVLMLLALVHLGLKHLRHVELLGLLAPILVMHPLAGQLKTRFLSVPPIPGAEKALLALSLSAALWAASLIPAITRPDGPVAPQRALAAARAAGLAGKPVFNAYNFGGYLIFEGVKVFVDGRAEPYGDDFLARYFGAEYGYNVRALQGFLRDYNIEWTILRPDTQSAQIMDLLPGWTRLYADKYAVVHARTHS